MIDASAAGLPLIERAVEWLAAVGRPLMVGLTVVAAVGATMGYVAVHGGWRLAVVLRMRQRGRRSGAAQT